MVNNNQKKTLKFLLFGLDNSGKTSILLSLTRNTNLLSYVSLKPTREINIVNFEAGNKIINLWDFGGQEKYRNKYLQDLSEYLYNVDKIIFVIDVQDTERYDLALDYLTQILNFLKKSDEIFEFSIFLHKHDPNLETLEKFKDGKYIDELTEKIKRIIPSEFSCGVFKTSIYTVFTKSSHLFL
ncbi:MAG: ADP-ribosylation factor-like protein [Promethearchaeota archaeon]